MRVLFSILVLSLLSVAPLSGNGGSLISTAAAQARDGERLQQFAERLNLTPQQREQVRPIFVDSFTERRAILKKHGIKKGQRPGLRKLLAARSELGAVRERTKGRLAVILSPAQMREYEKLSEEIRAEMRAKYLK